MKYELRKKNEIMKMNRQISRGGKYSKEHGKNTQMNDKKKSIQMSRKIYGKNYANGSEEIMKMSGKNYVNGRKKLLQWKKEKHANRQEKWAKMNCKMNHQFMCT